MHDVFEAFFILLGLAVGTFLCGFLPSMIRASPRVMNHIAIFGGGTIIGAAIIIILPECCGMMINTQYQLDELNGVPHEETVSSDTMQVIGLGIMAGFSSMLVVDEIFKILKKPAGGEVNQTESDASTSINANRDNDYQSAAAKRRVEIEVRKEKNKNSALLTTVALVMHSACEGIAMGSSLYRK